MQNGRTLHNAFRKTASQAEDAFHCFMGTEIEALAINNCFLRKEDHDPVLKRNYETAFELD